MRVFFRCVAEAVAENGLKGLAAMVPGGPYAYAVAESAWRKYRERCAADQQLMELQVIAEAKLEDARAEMLGIAREVFATVPAGPDDDLPLAEESIDLELFVAGIPDAVRQSLKRADDPTGRSVPHGFALRSADDVLKLLPARPPRFRPGDNLPGKSGWVLEHLLGMGGFGEVWFTRHARMTSLSGAVKFCFGQSGRDLIHEAALIDRVMQAGRHPNIVPLLDVHLEGDRPWLLFEYVAGGNLTDWIHRLAGRPPAERLPQVLAALRQLCEAVAHFHRLPVPIVHRDLKPSNILFDAATGRLRITDFGIGSITASETNRQENQAGMSRGGRLLTYLLGSCTPLYCSPQQRMGSDPDPHDDVHALGVIAFQMLTGKLDVAPGPRAGKALKEAGVGESLNELLLNCVSEHVEDRPADAGVLVTQLPTTVNPNEDAARRELEAEADAKWRQWGRQEAEARERVEAAKAEEKRLAEEKAKAADPFHPSRARTPGDTLTIKLPGDVPVTFAWCPSGYFQMGSNNADGREKPAHKVTLTKGFFTGIYPVTQAQWKALMLSNPSHFKGADRPVESVSWYDAQAFCAKFTELLNDKVTVQLPTEAEWEYICRAGTTTDYWNGNGEAALKRIGWYRGNSGGQTHPVGQLEKNPWGLYDVSGNVCEWCQDALRTYTALEQIDPIEKSDDRSPVVRGGSWDGVPNLCRAASRTWFAVAHHYKHVGFRVCFRLG